MKVSPGQRVSQFAVALMLAFLAGFALRVYLFADQVLIDDEWHGLYYVIGKSPGWLLTHFSIPGATCIPLNFYAWALGASVGWSETMLRLPSLVAGLLLLIIGPWLARDLVGARRAGIMALLLAISPMLIFYSRISRPYSWVALLGFVAILLAARWMKSGSMRLAVLYTLTATLAVYFHLFAVVVAGAPVLAALVAHGYARWRKTVAPGPPLKHWLIVAAIMAGIAAILVLPAFIDSLRSTFFKVALTGTFDVQAVPRVALLIAGTDQPVLALLFWAALIVGAVEQCRRDAWFGGMLVSLYPLHALALVLSRPDSAQSPIVLARYCMPLVPVSLFLAACGIQAALERLATRAPIQPRLQTVTAAVYVAGLALTGPLPQCYVTPNNFTSHGAFQHRYGLIDWGQSFRSDFTPPGFPLRTVIQAGEVSPFYRLLGEHPGPEPIVEYPMLIGDHFNLHYYYQHFHKRSVLVGYAIDPAHVSGLPPGNIFGNTYIDQVLSLVPDPSRLRFRTLVSMDDLAGMRARGAVYVILHKRFEAHLPNVAPPPSQLERLDREYRKTLGTPAFEDAHIVVFKLQP